jgi:hypothetical protein
MHLLDFGEGVVITYTDGDKCNSCTPRGPRQTVLRLTCNSYCTLQILLILSSQCFIRIGL